MFIILAHGRPRKEDCHSFIAACTRIERFYQNKQTNEQQTNKENQTTIQPSKKGCDPLEANHLLHTCFLVIDCEGRVNSVLLSKNLLVKTSGPGTMSLLPICFFVGSMYKEQCPKLFLRHEYLQPSGLLWKNHVNSLTSLSPYAQPGFFTRYFLIHSYLLFIFI